MNPPTLTARKADRRTHPRTNASGSVWWRTHDRVPFRSGWLIDRSSGGMGFLHRGADGPKAGAILEVRASTEPDRGPLMRVLVRRRIPIQGDLCLVGVERLAAPWIAG